MKVNEDWKQNNGKYKCPYCGELKTKHGICSHIICKHLENNKTQERLNNARAHVKNSNKNKKYIFKNNIIKCVHEEELNIYINNGWLIGRPPMIDYISPNRGRKFSDEYKRKLSNIMKEVAKNRPQEYKTGRGKQGRYKGFWCDSSWELAYVIYCLENNIDIIRNKTGFDYIYENEKHTYYPDFYNNNDNCYIEIKGYENDKDIAKISQFPDNIKVLYYQDLKEILKYVESKYGKDFIKLYDK